jgi:hypothetical protein
MSETVVEWLESPEGEDWSKRFHRDMKFPLPLISLKEDVPDWLDTEFAGFIWLRL